MTTKSQSQRYPIQRKTNDTVWVGNRQINAKEEAIRIANRCHGLTDWQGVMEQYGAPGLERLANAYLKTLGHGARLAETYINGGEYMEDKSRYSPYWV